ncbi:leucine-rich repeat domain-containing protein [Skeletonema marinoi]|uniref:Leucine-rich repeat domain-containing protein n=1 Tax=Skeletonema marinoi TaxID=267567 RepID=A0AAD9D6E1_9STRA|nr:leucine-rich repeat domain-containing protein [Skeletonema marinoi]
MVVYHQIGLDLLQANAINYGLIPNELFSSESNVQEVEMHNGVYKISKLAFYNCRCLERISGATGVQVIDEGAFYRCRRLKDLEVGLKIPSVKIVDGYAFQFCVSMTDVEFGEGLEQMEEFAFLNCYSLRRVAMPLKMDLISDNIFKGCTSMANIELVGKTSSRWISPLRFMFRGATSQKDRNQNNAKAKSNGATLSRK